MSRELNKLMRRLITNLQAGESGRGRVEETKRLLDQGLGPHVRIYLEGGLFWVYYDVAHAPRLPTAVWFMASYIEGVNNNGSAVVEKSKFFFITGGIRAKLDHSTEHDPDFRKNLLIRFDAEMGRYPELRVPG